MASSSYNPNPTIIKLSSRKQSVHNTRSLWVAEPEDDGYDTPEEVELIDQDEVFGLSISLYKVTSAEILPFADAFSRYIISCTEHNATHAMLSRCIAFSPATCSPFLSSITGPSDPRFDTFHQ